MFTEIVNYTYSAGVLVTILIALLSFVTLIFFRKEDNIWLSYVRSNALNLYFVLLIIAAVGSLYYSEIAGFVPCKLCWLQRIFIFSQLVMVIIAKIKRDGGIWNYLPWFSVLGLFFAVVHNYIYYFGSENSVTCDAAASCKAFYMFSFNLVTIPFMALGLLLSLLTIFAIHKYYNGSALEVVDAQ